MLKQTGLCLQQQLNKIYKSKLFNFATSTFFNVTAISYLLRLLIYFSYNLDPPCTVKEGDISAVIELIKLEICFNVKVERLYFYIV